KGAPAVGQLQKGGGDAATFIKDYLTLVRHMHLKDYKGRQWDSGYWPLGMGQVDLKAILEMMESIGLVNDVMVERDPSPDGPMTPLQTVQTTKAYLQKLGFVFHA